VSRIVVVGGGICGVGAALLLADDGHDVTLLERDEHDLPPSPQDAWEHWERKGVAQFRQPHNLMPGSREVLESELPDVYDDLEKAGAARFDFLDPFPPFLSGREPGDDRFWSWTARRPAAEWVFAKAAATRERIDVRRGVHVTGPVFGPSVADAIPHVVGVRTADGEEISADLVVDATGRRSQLPQWLTDAGGRPPYEDAVDRGFSYYTRYFRGTVPGRITGPLTALGSISLLTIPGDNGTWSMTLLGSTGDAPVKGLRHADRWTAVLQACPLHAHWLEGEPITDVLAMSGQVDRYRRFVVDGEPVVTGLLAVADAWACTNPSAGRGISVGLKHARLMKNVIAEHADDPYTLALAMDEQTEERIAPWYWAQASADRARWAQMDAIAQGREPEPPSDELGRSIAGLISTMGMDEVLFRCFMEYVGCVTPVQEILERPGVKERLETVMAAKAAEPPGPSFGPSRDELVGLLTQ
jgi:2-polyprenyl-6-methoxyphenol hydroxylase-like FAD-dependent oxidoreductase